MLKLMQAGSETFISTDPVDDDRGVIQLADGPAIYHTVLRVLDEKDFQLLLAAVPQARQKIGLYRAAANLLAPNACPTCGRAPEETT